MKMMREDILIRNGLRVTFPLVMQIIITTKDLAFENSWF
jgi:hypothetical protein